MAFTAKVYRLLSKSYPARVLNWVRRAEWTYTSAVPLSKIQMDRRPGGRDLKKVEAIASSISEGKAMDPVVLVRTSSGLKVADGYHRTLAFKRSGRKSIRAFIATGVGDSGPWDKAMHAAKRNTNKTVHVRGNRAVVKKE